jgi:hypothetical protein
MGEETSTEAALVLGSPMFLANLGIEKYQEEKTSVFQNF